MTRKCPRCHRGDLETWGIEATHLPTGKVFEQGMIFGAGNESLSVAICHAILWATREVQS